MNYQPQVVIAAFWTINSIIHIFDPFLPHRKEDAVEVFFPSDMVMIASPAVERAFTGEYIERVLNKK